MQTSITCLIPFYNERKRILYTLGKLSQVKEISKIICIDDGSTDNGYELIQKEFPKVEIIKLNKNSGKSNALYEGLKKVKTEYVLMFDGDLSNIKVDEVENGLDKIIQNKKIDMIIFRRIIESKILSLIRHDIVMSGKRILKANDLKEVYKNNPKDYEIEMAINDYMMKNDKKVYWMPLSTKNPKKIIKMSLSQSLRLYAKAGIGYFSYSGVSGYLDQIFNFCKEKAS